MAFLAPVAAALVLEVERGARASTLLAQAIAERRFGAEEAEQLSRLVYGVLRRKRRVAEALRELEPLVPQTSLALANVLGAALLDGTE